MDELARRGEEIQTKVQKAAEAYESELREAEEAYANMIIEAIDTEKHIQDQESDFQQECSSLMDQARNPKPCEVKS